MKIIGTDGKDSLIGTAKRDVLKGLGGNDVLKGLGGNDVLKGLAGDDLLLGGAGNDEIYAGTGDDTVIGGAGKDYLYKDLSAQTTAVNFSYTDPNSGNIQGIESVDLYTGSGDDTIVSTAAIGNGYTIYSNEGNDSITTGADRDFINAGAGDDYINAGAGGDFISSGTGNDTVIGGAGNDYLFKDLSEQTTAVNFSYTDPNSGSIQGIESVELSTGSGDDIIVSTAAIGTPFYFANSIYSSDGNDSITTGAGNDRIYAGAGRDEIYAGAGNDYIEAGKGNDTLTGGAGQDRFVFFASTEGIDRITDFTVIDDTIAVYAVGFGDDLSAVGAISKKQFIIGSAATKATQRFIYDSSNGALFFDADGVNGTAAIQFATLDPGLALTNADISVIQLFPL